MISRSGCVRKHYKIPEFPCVCIRSLIQISIQHTANTEVFCIGILMGKYFFSVFIDTGDLMSVKYKLFHAINEIAVKLCRFRVLICCDGVFSVNGTGAGTLQHIRALPGHIRTYNCLTLVQPDLIILRITNHGKQFVICSSYVFQKLIISCEFFCCFGYLCCFSAFSRRTLGRRPASSSHHHCNDR